MKHWVYIYKDGKNSLKIALSADIYNIILSLQSKLPIVYLRPFELPFDAIAHKHLLESISKESVLHWIEKNKEETKVWLYVANRN